MYWSSLRDREFGQLGYTVTYRRTWTQNLGKQKKLPVGITLPTPNMSQFCRKAKLEARSLTPVSLNKLQEMDFRVNTKTK